MLIKNETIQSFNTEIINCGMLIYAKHKTWNNSECGFLTHVDERMLIVQYYPGIGNVTNHFRIPICEVVAGEWELRYSEDMITIYSYPETEGNE